nr:unnamed protein product [Callosobruchus analis]
MNCSRCRFTCSEKISEETRRSICTVFWSCDFLRQKDFILNYVESTPPVRRRRRNKNGKTLSISSDVIEYAFAHKGDGGIFQGEDRCGRKTPDNKTREEDVQIVKSHIERFPAMESHYTRKSTRRKYLDSKLSISKMSSLCKELCKPNKDQRQICVKFSAATEEKKQQLEDEYNAHMKRKQDCYEAKVRDKARKSGYSYMEVDSKHSAIEHQQKFVPVYTVQDWVNIFHLARSQRKKKNAPPYNVRELKFSDFFDLSQLAKSIMKNKSRDVHGELVNWLKVSFRYLKNKPGVLEYRYDHTSDYKEINVLAKAAQLIYKK